ncbi:MAG: alpha-amylase family glycosyl hydrolase [Bacteroidetes bacterium]|nr:alpha-amylase family glycosyl hydrolase [Bacteroidota bacterium]
MEQIFKEQTNSKAINSIRKELILQLSDESVKTVHIGVYPPHGRYFRKKMKYKGSGLFKIDLNLPKGKFFYHFFLNNNFDFPRNDEQFVISKYDPQKRGSIVLETEIFCPIQFSNSPNCVSHIKDDIWEFRLITHQKWITQVAFSDEVEEHPFSAYYTEKNLTFWLLRIKLPKEEINYAIKFEGRGETRYLHANQNIFQTPVRELFFISKLKKKKDFLPFKAGYQILPDRFHRIPEKSEPINLTEWGTEPTHYSFFGGNIKGIISKLDYIADLGFDFLFLNPVFFSKSYHRYDCIDYKLIDPILGDESGFQELIANAHARGIKIIIDISINHCSTDFFAFKDIVVNQAQSVYINWFEIEQFPLSDETRHYYSSWHGYKDMPQFNFSEKEVQDYFLSIAKYWPQKFDIDGWRLDVVSEMPVSFIRKFVTASRTVKPDLIVIGEIWDNNLSDFVIKSGMNGLTNFSLYLDCLIPFFQYESLSISNLVLSIIKVLGRNSFDVNQSSWSFLSNHDIARFYSILKDKRKYSLALTLIYGILGTPVVYYGEEVCMEGLADPANRQCMDFESPKPAVSVIEIIRNLNSIKARYEDIFNYGTTLFPVVDNSNKLMIIQRSFLTESIFIVFNFDNVDHCYLHPMVHIAKNDIVSPPELWITKHSVELFYFNGQEWTCKQL